MLDPPLAILQANELQRATLHEVLAAPGHAHAAAAFGLALAARARAIAGDDTRTLFCASQDVTTSEIGDLYGQGLMAFGVDPGHCVLARLRTMHDVLRAALEAARCPTLGAVLIELKDPIDLTSSRRLKLAAERSGVTLIAVRHTDTPIPNAARTRWRAQMAPSQGSAWRRPTFDVTLLKHHAGLPETRWIVEWDRERLAFVPALSRPVAAAPASRPLAA